MCYLCNTRIATGIWIGRNVIDLNGAIDPNLGTGSNVILGGEFTTEF